jgi:hypothetical protein
MAGRMRLLPEDYPHNPSPQASSTMQHLVEIVGWCPVQMQRSDGNYYDFNTPAVYQQEEHLPAVELNDGIATNSRQKP